MSFRNPSPSTGIARDDTPSEKLSIKCVVIGDGCVGKTSLLYVYVDREFPEEYNPTVFDNYNVDLLYEDKMVSLSLWDTSGQSEYDNLRHLGYDGTQVFLVCFSLVNRSSFYNVREKWLPEIQEHQKNAAFILVGTQIDSRVAEKSASKCVPFSEGQAMARELGALCYVECSAKLKIGVNRAFDAAIQHQIALLLPKEEGKKETLLAKIQSAIWGRRKSRVS